MILIKRLGSFVLCSCSAWPEVSDIKLALGPSVCNSDSWRFQVVSKGDLGEVSNLSKFQIRYTSTYISQDTPR
ncbi:hypothetical protein B0H12DRAFT_1097379 [Mycena haematopus]|nr:hypothetical protein B0H12DRAFT_1097379 [Mycena haematopus]